jgi:hypothetical protein
MTCRGQNGREVADNQRTRMDGWSPPRVFDRHKNVIMTIQKKAIFQYLEAALPRCGARRFAPEPPLHTVPDRYNFT